MVELKKEPIAEADQERVSEYASENTLQGNSYRYSHRFTMESNKLEKKIRENFSDTTPCIRMMKREGK